MIQLPYLPKPLRGQPCNGCGYCCAQQVCAIGEIALGKQAKPPCRLLIYRDGRTYCGAVEKANRFLRVLLKARLGIGWGCCSDDPDDWYAP